VQADGPVGILLTLFTCLTRHRQRISFCTSFEFTVETEITLKPTSLLPSRTEEASLQLLWLILYDDGQRYVRAAKFHTFVKFKQNLQFERVEERSLKQPKHFVEFE